MNVPEQSSGEAPLRRPAYLSPSALKVFEEDKSKYFIQYLSPVRLPREPQEDYMAIGGAFDVLVKKEFGWKGDWVPDEVRNYDADDVRARAAGLFRQYKACGALARLVGNVVDVLWIEDSIVASPAGSGLHGPLLGKPDFVFRDPLNRVVGLDWKVNGSSAGVVPAAKSGWKYGHTLAGTPLERGRAKGWTGMIHEEWADQLATYQLILLAKGQELGWFPAEVPLTPSTVHCRIEQLRCTRGGLDSVVVHEGQPSIPGNSPERAGGYETLLSRYQACWEYALRGAVVEREELMGLVNAFAPCEGESESQRKMKEFMYRESSKKF